VFVYFKNLLISLMPVAHACNASYSGGRGQEDYGSKPAQANSLRDHISKKSLTQKKKKHKKRKKKIGLVE
jgi:hypothetical protein